MSLEDTLYPLLRLYESAPQPLKSLAGHVYRSLPSFVRYGRHYGRFCKETHESLLWDSRAIRDYQIEAIRDSLAAASQSPFYAEQFAKRGLNPMKFESLEQLADYPLISRDDVLHQRERMVNPQFKPYQRLYITTGGSSGVPMGLYLQRGISRSKEQAHLESIWQRAGYVPGSPTAVIRGHAIHGRHPWFYDPTRNWLVLSSACLNEKNCRAYLDEINRFKPHFINAYPSSALILARHMAESGVTLDCEIKAMLCGSEHLSPMDRSWLEQVFRTKVFRWYGHSERVLLAGEYGGTNRYHFSPTYGYVELGEITADGYREIIGTSFHNHVMPFIRYRTSDYVIAASVATDDETPWPSAAEVVGRESEFIVAADGRRVPMTVVNRHDDSFAGLLALQFHQHVQGELELHYVPSAGFSSTMLGKIEAAILASIGLGFQLRFKAVEEVKPGERGKRRWLVSSLSQKIRN
jgi:phenylacetate-CoA ligase